MEVTPIKLVIVGGASPTPHPAEYLVPLADLAEHGTGKTMLVLAASCNYFPEDCASESNASSIR